MSQTRATIRTLVRTDLDDNNVASMQFQDEDINQAIQDAYNEIVAKTQCIVKKVTLNWADCPIGNYFDFLNDFGVTDFMATVGIFNNLTNMWLRDDISYRDLSRIRVDWELWRGNPQFWVPHSLQYSLIVPINQAPSGTFDLWYWASAPVLSSDSTALLIAPDLSLPELYTMTDLLESIEEFSKAQTWKQEFLEELLEYKRRCHDLAQFNFLPRV